VLRLRGRITRQQQQAEGDKLAQILVGRDFTSLQDVNDVYYWPLLGGRLIVYDLGIDLVPRIPHPSTICSCFSEIHIAKGKVLLLPYFMRLCLDPSPSFADEMLISEKAGRKGEGGGEGIGRSDVGFWLIAFRSTQG
jgi:hypothetical protein